MATPNWTGATANNPLLASQVNQMLGTHAFTVAYKGAQKDNQSTTGAGATNSNSLWIAQKFTAGASYTSGRVVLTLAVTGSPGVWVVTLRPDNAGAPSTSILATANVPNSFAPGSAGAVSIPLSASLTSTSVYWIVAQAVGDVSNFYSWSKSNQVSGTSTSANGTTWAAQTYGCLFQVWDNSTTNANSPVAHTVEDSGARWTSFGQTASRQLVTLDEYTTAQGGSYVQSAATLGYTNGLPTSTTQGAAANTVAPWATQHAGILGQADAMAGAAGVNQFLGTHPGNQIYQGNPIVTPVGQCAAAWALQLSTLDIDQPFTMSGTAIGRVTVPLLPVGGGADLIVSLCADSAGNPGTVIARARIPASWVSQLAAVNGIAGPSSTAPTTQYTGNPLALTQFNTLLYGGWQSVPWSPPATGATGGLSTARLAQSGPYLIFAGGVNAANGNSSATVAVITWLGGSILSPTAPGPSLPQPLLSGGLAVTPDCLCYVGGVNIAGATTVVQSTVYLALWDSSTGAIGSWSVQTPLPQALVSPGVAAYGPTDTVYVVGGSTNYAPQNAMVSTVYYATITSQQITAWTAAAPLPVALADPTVAVVGNFLIVAGGFNASGLGITTVYYAPINPATGALGSWQAGPPIPTGLYVEGPAAVSAYGIAWPQSLSTSTSLVSQDTLTLSWGTDGPGPWTHQIGPITVLNQDQVTAMMAAGDGTYQIFNFQDSAYLTGAVLSVPTLSVPLPTSGLTNSATYHILLQQPGGDANDYLRVATDLDALPGNPTVKTSPKNTGTWTAYTPAGTCVPIQVFDNSNGNAAANGATGNNQVWHTWDDRGARTTTLARAATPDQRLLGILESTAATTQLNANSGFQNGITPWTGVNGSLAQSTAQSYEGGVSGLLTPTGGNTTAYIQSEFIHALPGVSYTLSGWCYSPGGYANVFAALDWWTQAQSANGAGSTTFAVAAATWTPFSYTYTGAGGTGYLTINVGEGSNPASGNTVHFDQVMVYETYGGTPNATVAEISYPGTWPGTGLWPPTGVTVLS